MIDALITWSLKNRIIVLMIAGGIIAYGIYAVKNTPVDAIPDLSEHQYCQNNQLVDSPFKKPRNTMTTFEHFQCVP